MFVLVNLKAYDVAPVAVAEAAGEAAAAAGADGESRVAVAPPATAIDAVARRSGGVETWAQHVAPVGPGSHTGSVRAAAAADAGAAGTLLNHSERRLTLAALADALDRARAAGLETVACANTPDQAAAVAALGPDAVALEPPELIGTGTPVSRADPGIVKDAVAAVAAVDPDIEVFCGAGISSGADVTAARELGATGVLVASAVAKAEDPAAALRDLLEG